jgi:hypothetical protein
MSTQHHDKYLSVDSHSFLKEKHQNHAIWVSKLLKRICSDISFDSRSTAIRFFLAVRTSEPSRIKHRIHVTPEETQPVKLCWSVLIGIHGYKHPRVSTWRPLRNHGPTGSSKSTSPSSSSRENALCAVIGITVLRESILVHLSSIKMTRYLIQILVRNGDITACTLVLYAQQMGLMWAPRKT